MKTQIERRQSQPSVPQLRRFVRESDEERFQLEHALSTAAAAWLHGSHAAVSPPKRFGRITAATAALLALATGGFVWIQWRPAPRVTATSQIDVKSTPVPSVQIVEERPAMIEERSAMIRERAATVGEQDAIAGKRSGPKAVYRPTYATRSIRRSPLDSRRRGLSPKFVRPIPRPLSPGEFGRPPAAPTRSTISIVNRSAETPSH